MAMARAPRAGLRRIISTSLSSDHHHHHDLNCTFVRTISSHADPTVRGSLKGGGDTADVAIIGGGIVGLATAREIVNRFSKASVVVVEKEKKLVPHQTSHNRYK